MKRLVNISIDVTKIDKSKLFKGQKGTYLDCQVFLDDEDDQYGKNGMITQSVSKEEREAGVRGAILGNADIKWRDDAPGIPNKQGPITQEELDDVPF